MQEPARGGQVNARRSKRELPTTLTKPLATSDTLGLASLATPEETLLFLRGLPFSDTARRVFSEPMTGQSKIGLREQDEIDFRQAGGKRRPASDT